MISFRTAYQRGTAACELLRDLKLRATNPITVEVCDLCIKLISAPPHEREAVDERIVELVAQATARRSRIAAFAAMPDLQPPITKGDRVQWKGHGDQLYIVRMKRRLQARIESLEHAGAFHWVSFASLERQPHE